MRLAKNALLSALLMLTLVFTMSAQTLRSEEDNRNIAPTVGTGGNPGGPTGLFTIYDGTTLRRGEFTFSAAYSNFDRDPGDVDITEVPVSFQIGLSDNLELFFNTDAYRAVKVNSPRNLSSFYLPNVTLSSAALGNIEAVQGAIVLAPQGAGTSAFAGRPFYRRAGAPYTPFPYVGGNFGNNGFTGAFNNIGTALGFGTGSVVYGAPVGSNGNTAANFPGLGSIYGSILPGVVLAVETVQLGTGGISTTRPVIYSTQPSYLPDAPFIGRTYGESSFNTFTVGAKFRLTGVNNPFGLALVPFYRFYADKADDASGFNQLQRGASPGGNRGDFGLTLAADYRAASWLNVSGNVGYIYNSSVKANFPGGEFTILDRGDELNYGMALDFPVNKYFQPILELRGTRYVVGRTPNAFENNPLDGLAGFRVFPRRWFGMGFAYRYHFNQQDFDSVEDVTATQTVTVAGPTTAGGTTSIIVPTVTTSRPLANAFRTSSDPHGFIVQLFAGHRNARGQKDIPNQPANVTGVTTDKTTVVLPCPPGTRSETCVANQSVAVSTTALDPEGDVLTYSYTVSGGQITGTGANVNWDLTGVRPGTYTVTAAVDDGCGFCGTPKSTTITVAECADCRVECVCPTVSVSEPSSVTAPGGTMTFTANVSGGGDSAVTYNWTVSQGEIVSGQGTPTITVQTTPAMAGSNVTATVNLGNLCTTCPATSASGTGSIAQPPTPTLVDEFGSLTPDDLKARLDPFFSQLQNDPSATGTIIISGNNREFTREERKIRNAISFRQFDASRINIVRGSSEPGVNIKLYLVPAGATAPTN
jgi:hypothetical protein